MMALSCVALAMLTACNSDSKTDEEILASGGYDAGIMGTSSFRLDLHDFTNGYLSGTWQGNIIELTERTEDLTDDECYTGDIMGECYERIHSMLLGYSA